MANLAGADLTAATLARTILDRSDFTGTILDQTIFHAVNLSGVSGIEFAKHTGPSSIDIDTLFLSRGAIDHGFLRGVGIPELSISSLKRLISAIDPIQFYSLFISYSTPDQEFAERLHADLQARGIRCWFAPHDIQGGRKIHEQIDEAIRLHDKLLLILSADSIESSWVETEISTARKREVRDKARVLFPVRLVPFEVLRDWECFDADTGKDSAREIREYFIPDFSKWKDHDSYRAAFDRLVRDLQAPARGQ